MAGKTTVACTQAQYEVLISSIYDGIGTSIRPNPRIAAALEIEANTGLRIGDVLSLRLSSIVKDGKRYRFNITEQKTGKKRTFTVPNRVYDLLVDYCEVAKIGNDELIFPITVRAVQKHLSVVVDYLGAGYEHIGTHSFRKYYASRVYEKSNYDVELVRRLMQHSSVAITSRYLGIADKRMDSVLNECVSIVRK